MNYEQSDLDLMKRDVDEFGVEALLTPEALKLLIADLEEARAAAIERAGEFRREAHAHFVAAGEIEKLEAEIAELRADKARLDWLEKESPFHLDFSHTANPRHELMFARQLFSGHTFRAAIDAAMKAAL